MSVLQISSSFLVDMIQQTTAGQSMNQFSIYLLTDVKSIAWREAIKKLATGRLQASLPWDVVNPATQTFLQQNPLAKLPTDIVPRFPSLKKMPKTLTNYIKYALFTTVLLIEFLLNCGLDGKGLL